MKAISNKITRAWIISILTVAATACYDEFDPKSYMPTFTISGFSSVDQIEPGALVSYWSFDEGLTDAVSGAAGTNKGTTLTKGFKGQALSLNGSGKSYVTAPSNPVVGMQSFTISFWVNPTFVDANADNSIDGILGFVNLSNQSNFWGNIDWFVENGSTPDAAKIVVHVVSGTQETWFNVSGYKGLFGTWTNHTVTYDAATSKFIYYINGSTAATATAAWTGAIGFTNSGPMVFGTVQFQTTPSLTSNHGTEPWASYLTGTMDELRIYNKALSAENVNALVVLQGKGK